MGECDLVLLDVPNFGGGGSLGLHVDIRTTIRYDYSFIESAVLRIGNDTLEVSSFGQYGLGGIDHADLEDASLAGFPVVHTKKSSKHHVFDVILGDQSNITISTFKDLVSVKITGATTLGDSVGIMGSVTDGAMLARDGTSIMDVSTVDGINAFGQEWQVRPDEPMLFRTARSPQASNGEACFLPQVDTKQSLRRRLKESTISRSDAEEACAHLNGKSKDACVLDVLAVGDLEVAQAGAY